MFSNLLIVLQFSFSSLFAILFYLSNDNSFSRKQIKLPVLSIFCKFHSLLHSPCHVIACEDGAVYKCVTAASTPTTPLLTRLREPPSSPATLYVATATDITSTSEVAGNSRVALLTNCSTNFQDQFFPT